MFSIHFASFNSLHLSHLPQGTPTFFGRSQVHISLSNPNFFKFLRISFFSVHSKSYTKPTFLSDLAVFKDIKVKNASLNSFLICQNLSSTVYPKCTLESFGI